MTKRKLPKKTEKVLRDISENERVLRDMAKDRCEHRHELGGCHKILGCPPNQWDGEIHASLCPPHKHDSDSCPGCEYEWEQGEKFGRENHVVTKCNHPEPKPVVIGTPWSVHIAWALFAGIYGLIAWAVGYGPNWAGAVRP